MSLETNTQTLLLRVRNGDQEALNDLYQRYVQRVLAAVRARLGPELRRKVESWDIVQEVMVASLRGVSSFEYESEGAFIRWLSQIVENRVRDQFRFHRAERRDQRRDQPAQNPDSVVNVDLGATRHAEPTPSQILELHEDLSLLERAMDALPEDARNLITAVKIEGRTYAEIATESGRSPDAVRMQANRAMAALTRAFQQLQPVPGTNEESP